MVRQMVQEIKTPPEATQDLIADFTLHKKHKGRSEISFPLNFFYLINQDIAIKIYSDVLCYA